MATYKGIQGYRVQKLSSDPTASEAVGQLWYNSSAGKFKIGTQAVGAWASAPSLNTERANCASAGTSTAAIIGGGEVPPYTANSESYNGTTWTEVADLATAAYSKTSVGAAPGGSTTSIAWSGNSTTSTEEWTAADFQIKSVTTS